MASSSVAWASIRTRSPGEKASALSPERILEILPQSLPSLALTKAQTQKEAKDIHQAPVELHHVVALLQEGLDEGEDLPVAACPGGYPGVPGTAPPPPAPGPASRRPGTRLPP